MITIQRPSSLDVPELQPYRVRNNASELQQQGLFLAEGKRVVVRMLLSQIRTRSILTTEEVWRWVQQQVPHHCFETISLYLADRDFLSSLVGYDVQQPILALGEVPPDTTPEQLVAKKSRGCLFVASDRLMNPDNVGVILRNCAAFDVDLFIAGPSSASPYYRRAVRNSMGTVFSLPTYHSPSLEKTLSYLRGEKKFQIVGAHPSGSHSLQNFSFASNVCLVFGNEENGIGEEVLQCCTHTVSIPLKPSVDSFNVANAAAIFLWEAFRQKQQPAVSD